MRKLLLAGALLASSPAWGLEELSVMISGNYREPIEGYRVGSDYYLSAKQAGSLYGGQVYWYPVSGRVQLSFRGRPLQLLVNSDEARTREKTLKLESPVILRASQAFIPLSFLLSEGFSDLAGADSSFDARTRLLTIEKRSTVGPLSWFSYPGRTRLSLELGRGLTYSVAARGVGGVLLSVHGGTIEGSEQSRISDGIVDSYSLLQRGRSVQLSVKFSRPGTGWKTEELADSRRVVLELIRPGAEGPRSPAVSAPPAAPAQVSTVPFALPNGAQKRRRRIVIDAGHGGRDAGATGRRGAREKDINLLTARELSRLLREEGSFEVLLTRSEDVFVPLSERSRLANEFGADLFISLHCNASNNPRDSGFEVYFLSEKASDPEAERVVQAENSVLEFEGKSASDEQAALLLRELTKTENINAASELAALIARDLGERVSIENRGVKQAGFYVLRGTHSPAVLFEMAYISNRKDETRLESKRFRRRLIDGLYAGVLDYARREGWMSSPAD